MSSPDDETPGSSPAQRIAHALARLRGPRGPRPGPFDRPGRGFGSGGFEKGLHDKGPHTHGLQHGSHAGHGAFRFGEHGPAGRFGAKFRLLEALSDASAPLSVSEIGERVGVDQPRASRLVQACVDDGLVQREADPDDARRTNVALTEAGRMLVDRARGARQGAVEQALAGFSDVEREQLAALLERFVGNWPR